jgi:AGCS family alanine or glycine:cation symporter
MYAIENGMGKKYRPLALMFAIFGLIGTLALFQVNQLSSFLRESYEVSEYISGLTMTFILIYILRGGLKRIASFTSRVVPLMAFLYLIICLIILGKNYDLIIPTFIQILKNAFGSDAVVGGTIGYGLLYVIQTGVKRAAFSNEAGVGTAPMAHGNAKTNEPISEGYVAMLGPFIDTIIVCTLTALTILIGTRSMNIAKDTKGINLTTFAIENQLGEYGVHFLCIIIFLFAFSTMIGMANYNKKCWDYLFRGRYKMNRNIFILFYSFAIGAAAVVKIDLVVALIDICYAMMAVPNIIVTLFLAKSVSLKLKDYNSRMRL